MLNIDSFLMMENDGREMRAFSSNGRFYAGIYYSTAERAIEYNGKALETVGYITLTEAIDELNRMLEGV